MPTKKEQATQKPQELVSTNTHSKGHGLGKGIGALLGSTPDVSIVTPQSPSRIQEKEFEKIKISLIDTNPWQPRSEFEEEALAELVESIKTNGLIQPITVRLGKNGRYQLIAGERRLRASKLAGMETIAAFIRTANDMQMLEMGLVENIQRKDLNPIEIALSFQRLMNECNLKQDELAAKVAKSRPLSANYLRLLKLSTPVQKYICEGRISMGHAKMLASLDDIDQQKEIADKVIADDLSVRQLENLIKKINQDKNADKKPTKLALPQHLVSVRQQLSEYYHADIKINRNIKGKGQIVLAFKNDKDLERILDLLKK